MLRRPARTAGPKFPPDQSEDDIDPLNGFMNKMTAGSVFYVLEHQRFYDLGGNMMKKYFMDLSAQGCSCLINCVII